MVQKKGPLTSVPFHLTPRHRRFSDPLHGVKCSVIQVKHYHYYTDSCSIDLT